MPLQQSRVLANFRLCYPRRYAYRSDLLMTFVANQSLFRVNQELLALSSMNPSVQAKVDCFNVARKNCHKVEWQPRPQPSSFSASPSRTNSLDDRAALYATPQHFPALVSAFSAAFPDFDFSTVCPWNFRLVWSPEEAQASLNWAFQTELPDCEQTLTNLWAALEKEISPAVCAIYSYEPDRPDAFSESGAIFNLCYFFLNEKTNKLVLVHLMEGGESLDSGSEHDLDEEPYEFALF